MLCALLAAPAGAGEIAYHEKFDAAVEAAEKSRQLVMVVVVAPVTDKNGREICKAFREETLADAQIAKLIRRHFAPFLLDIAAVREGKQAVPPVVQACFKQGEQIQIPQAIFLDAKCKEVHRIVGYAPPQGYIGLLRKAIEKALALIPEKDRRDAQRAFERGKQAFAEKDFAAAVDALKTAVACGVPGDDADAANQLLDEVEAKAAEAHQAAVAFEDSEKLGSAVRAYRDCARGFQGTEAAGKAAARLAEIRRDPEIRKRLNHYMAASLLAKAQEDVQQKRFVAAVECLETILKRYADTEEAAEARKLRQQIDGNPEAARAIRDAQARSEAQGILSMGDSFRRNRMPQKALAEYEKVLAKFPDTTFARMAKERIAVVKKELGESP